MISIRKRRRIRTLTKISLTIILLTIFMIIIGFKPVGIHKKNISKIDIPKDTILYLSVNSIDDSILKIVNSIYTHKIVHDKSLYNFAIMLKYIKVFTDDFLNKDFPVGILGKYLFSRNASLMLWGTNQVNTVLDSEWYFMFDVGHFSNFAIKKILTEEVTILDNKYILNSSKYQDIDVVSVSMEEKNNIVLYFAIYKGRLIFTEKIENIKKILDFLGSKTSKIDKIIGLKNIETKFSPDMSLYIDYDGYKKIFNFKENTFLDDMKFSKLYGYISLDYEKIDLDIHMISESNNIKPNKIKQKIIDYVPSSSPLYLGLSIGNSYLYTNISKYNIINTIPLLKNTIDEFRTVYKLGDIIHSPINESAIFFITNSDNKIYPILAANIIGDEIVIPELEVELLKISPNMEKNSISYENQFIYTYKLENNNSLSYTFIDDVFLFSKTQEALKISIDSYKDKRTISYCFKKNQINTSDKNYLFESNFKNTGRILKQLDSDIEDWSYPEYILAGVKLSKNITTIETRIYLNLKNVD